MKKTIGIVGGFVLTLLFTNAQAQDTTNKWDPRKNPTVDSIVSPYHNKVISTRAPLTTADIFPVIGHYESTVNMDASHVSINLDEQNKGLVWIEGLPQGRIKALLKKSPATYKIPAQKTEDGKEVAEGTLIFDKETNTLSICIGKPFNDADPAAAFAAPAAPESTPATARNAKTKKPAAPKAWMYVGTKQAKETVMN